MLRLAASLLSVGLLVAGCSTAAPDLSVGADPDVAVSVDPAPDDVDSSTGDVAMQEPEASVGGDPTGDASNAAVAEPVATAVPSSAPAAEAKQPPASLWWTAETVAGGQLASADLAGSKLVLWMWAPWCSVCNREAPDVAAAIRDLPDDVTLVGVAGRDEVGPMRDFIAEHGLEGIDHVIDEDGSLWASYGISYQPAWVFIDPDGEASVAAGALGYDGLFTAIEQAFGGA